MGSTKLKVFIVACVITIVILLRHMSQPGNPIGTLAQEIEGQVVVSQISFYDLTGEEQEALIRIGYDPEKASNRWLALTTIFGMNFCDDCGFTITR